MWFGSSDETIFQMIVFNGACIGNSPVYAVVIGNNQAFVRYKTACAAPNFNQSVGQTQAGWIENVFAFEF